ncbi:MAG TPA: protein translocase subunit SecF [Acidimicrobiales bacterium]|jgi:preprotein translocase subunit SecF|nr:protein translocase subunit SecF [Acidimicrobiales bacterium]
MSPSNANGRGTNGKGGDGTGLSDEDEAALELEEAFDQELESAAEEWDRDERGEKPHNVFVRLYRGETSFDFIGNRRWWFGVSAVIILLGVISLGTRGLNLGIDFKGGQSWLVSSQTLTVGEATSVVESAGVTQPTVVQLTNQLNHQKQIQVQVDLNSKSVAERTAIENKVQDALAAAAHTSPNNVNFNDVGPTWGGQVTSKAIEALIVFFIAVTLYISARFEFKMAVAAIAAVIHDILVTVGVYSLTGFQVTPSTVIAVLTVLGYSLYDTVVVFDRIRENAKGLGASGRITYSDMVNLSMNQTLARSINTSLVAIVPVLSVLIVGSFILGATSLQDFGLALVIGLTSGAYSSIFIASPLLAFMKEREPRYTTIRQRLETRGERGGVLTPAAAAAMAGASGGGRPQGRARAQTAGVIRPGAASSARSKGGAVKGGGSEAAPSTGAAASSGNARASTGARAASGSTRPGGNRPPPRPRKGKGGKGGKGKRR